MDKESLIACFEDTKRRIQEDDALRELTNQAVQSTVVIPEQTVFKEREKRFDTQIWAEGISTVFAAKKYSSPEGEEREPERTPKKPSVFNRRRKELDQEIRPPQEENRRYKTAVLNFANPENPGGGVRLGAMAQEECLCRSSNLYACLSAQSVYEDYYQFHRNLPGSFYSDRLIYSEGVTIFKDGADTPRLMNRDEWFQVDVITCAAPNLAQRRYTNATVLWRRLQRRIRNILEAAANHGVEVLILGAFGCGAFKNPPSTVAYTFKEVIDEYYRGVFKKIIFAIKRTTEEWDICPNLMAFEYAFNGISSEANKMRFVADLEDCYIIDPSTGEEKSLRDEGKRTYQDWRQQNRYWNKQFSIFGASCCTLEGYNPRGYKVFYQGENCEKSGVMDMADTWWGKVIGFFGGLLLVNNSWSGSRVTRFPNTDTDFPAGCSDERTRKLHIDSVMPEVIIVHLGANDWAYGVTVAYDTDDLTPRCYEFNSAYHTMIHKIMQNYPFAEVFCCTLNTTFMSSTPSFSFPYTYGGTHIEAYNDVIRQTAADYHCKLIDLYSFQQPYDTIDGSHPTREGMNTLARMMLESMTDDAGKTHLETYFRLQSQ